jgi:hypothetical protein
MDDFAKSKIAATNKELVEERAFVADASKVPHHGIRVCRGPL